MEGKGAKGAKGANADLAKYSDPFSTHAKMGDCLDSLGCSTLRVSTFYIEKGNPDNSLLLN